MAKQYLDYDGLLYFWQKLKAYFVPQTRKINNKALSADITLTASDVSALPDSTTIPSPGTGSSYPTMDGTKALGTNAGYARVDHVHPHDTSRVPTSRTVNGHALSANVTVTASDIGVESGAEVNVIETVKVNGTALTVTDKAVDVTVPTKTSDLTNDSNFVSDASYVHTDNNFTTTLKNKLDGIASGAEVNVQADWNVTTTTSDAYIKNKPTIPTLQNVFGIVKVGTTNIEADTTRDTLTLEAGNNVTLTPDATNDKVTISATDTTYSDVVAGGASGLMTGADKTKLDGIEAGAEVNVVDNVTSPTSGGTKVIDIFVGSNIFEAISIDAKGSANGVASLDASGKVPSSQLPSYVDDVVEAYPRSGATELSATWLSTSSGGAALTPETGVIYILMADSASYSANSQFRWSGTTYVKLADGGVSSITNAEIDTIVAS